MAPKVPYTGGVLRALLLVGHDTTLQPLVKSFIHQYNAPSAYWITEAPFNIMCDILEFGLKHGEFFIKQQKWMKDGFKVLRPEVIDKAKNNICLALDELDRFFSHSMNTNVHYSMYLLKSMGWHFLGRKSQYLLSPQCQEEDEVQV
ncbi:hypothetical protein EDD18DRAFT_1108339 [Armillaria luteobubalina]|uniref:Uncharacterized protein n=1 Tax=Armillaria luteobubalina TaxID=153913 RepID=A0AA39PYV6_9AGAR|nr:hypothetical protein EDD18DRAFT_1108339 [Armillaria luteobubalina]